VPSVQRSAEPVRHLSASDLGVGAGPALEEHSSNRPDDPELPRDHPLLTQVRGLLEFFGGILFTGPPGTSKSYFAAKIGNNLAGDGSRIRFVQFHPSYQYEDFMQGFVPNADGDGFALEAKYFVSMCRNAVADPENTHVLVIDELSRGDPGRVFGEALTYIEKSKRGLSFSLASGDNCVVPPNLVILATMNPLDRGVDEVDAAFERRFAKIAMEPDRNILDNQLATNGVSQPLRRRVTGFFDRVNGFARTSPQGTIGHTYFWDVFDEASLQRVWDHQLRFLLEKAYRLDPETFKTLRASFERIFDATSEVEQPTDDAPSDEPESHQSE